ncbi:hypothetical protein LCGC14_0984390 [marine sediment metagenome]|uniref:Uncharacterized protein n=1 Tax=marine sediment metagenome TaxID=412755 RepID=A0A0F9NC63_9ZZZZ
MSDMEIACWFDMGRSTCLLPDDHDGPHEPTPDSEIFVELVDKPTTEPVLLRPDVTPVVSPTIRLPGILVGVVLSIPWWIGLWHIVRWIFS